MAAYLDNVLLRHALVHAHSDMEWWNYSRKEQGSAFVGLKLSAALAAS